MNPPTIIPQELIGVIADYLEEDLCTKDLMNLSLTSRGFRSESQRALFRSPNLMGRFHDTNVLTKPWERKTHQLFLIAISQDPTRLGSYVHVYTSAFLTYPLENDGQGAPNNLYYRPKISGGVALWNLTCAVLPLLVNLQHLTFGYQPLPTSNCNSDPVAVLRSCTFPMLQSFAWLNSADIIPLAYEFLCRHPQLRSLTLREGLFDENFTLHPRELPENFLPNLDIIHASWNVLSALLPQRTVSSVGWSVEFRPQIKSGSRALDIAVALRGTRHLSVPGHIMPDDALSNVSSLEVLCLTSGGSNLVRYDQIMPTIQRSCADLTSTLKVFPLKALQRLNRLRKIIFRHTRGFKMQIPDDAAWWTRKIIPKVQEAFEVCTSLERVYVGMVGGRYKCVQRGATEGVNVGPLGDLSSMKQHFAPWIPRKPRGIEIDKMVDFYM